MCRGSQTQGSSASRAEIDRLLGAGRPVAGQGEHERLAGQRPPAHPLRGGQLPRQRHVDRVLPQRLHRDVGVELVHHDLDAGMLLPERRQHRRQGIEERRGHCPYPQPAELAPGRLTDGCLRGLGPVEQLPAVLQQHRAGRGQRHRPSGPGEQCGTQPVLERLMACDSGGCDIWSALGGPPEVQLFGHGHEVPALPAPRT